MEPTDLTIEILKSIRDEVKSLGTRVDATNSHLDRLSGRVEDTNSRLDHLEGELGRRIVESEMRTATAIVELAGTVRDLTGLLRAQHDLRPRVESCEREIEALKRRIPD